MSRPKPSELSGPLCGVAIPTHHRAFDLEIIRYDASYRIRVELPEGMKAGEGEKSMLLAFDGRALTLPREEKSWPLVV